ncbi:MAG TPA: response regulator transcription factor [Bryobacterales bacterium]|nr:response regulator transcription factor [Bryobacterales bacterium]
MIHTIVAEAGQLLSEGLAQSLQEEPELAASPATGSLEEALESCREHRPSVLLAGESFLETMDPRRLRDQMDYGRGAAVLVLASDGGGDHVLSWLRLGCMGHLSRCDSIATLKMAIRAVAGGQLWARRTDVAVLLRELLEAGPGGGPSHGPRLTAREEQILDLIADSARNADIAARLFISLETVRWHARRLMVKSGARDRASLIEFARRRRLAWRMQGAAAPAVKPCRYPPVRPMEAEVPSSAVGISHRF